MRSKSENLFRSQAKAKVDQEPARIVDHQGTERPFLCKLDQHVGLDRSGRSATQNVDDTSPSYSVILHSVSL